MTSAPGIHEPPRPSTLTPRPSYQSMAGLRRKEALTAYLFIAPTMLGYLVFIAGPMVSSLGMSLFEWDIVSKPQFIGLDNYAFLIQDPGFRTAFRNTATFALLERYAGGLPSQVLRTLHVGFLCLVGALALSASLAAKRRVERVLLWLLGGE